MKELTLQAMAKVNLGLDVVRRLENGYHEVRMIMQSIRLYDELTFEKTESGIVLVIDKDELPADENNLIYKSAKLIAEHYPLSGGVKITLKKHIPMAAGMAGGSTDAAATFHGLNRLFSLGMSLEEMQRLGVKIGADVPFCMAGGTMLSEGIGEVLTELPNAPEAFLVIAKPDISVSTKYVYENLHVEQIEHHPNMQAVEDAIRAGNLQEMCAHMENILENVTEKQHPIIRQIKERLTENGAAAALMSGSGPTVFGIFEERETAQRAFEALQECGLAKDLLVTTFSDTACVECGTLG